MRFFLTLFLFAVLVVGIVQVVELGIQQRATSEDLAALQKRATELERENQGLDADLNYFQDDRNLGKEFRSKFNYRDPKETMIILVPPQNGE